MWARGVRGCRPGLHQERGERGADCLKGEKYDVRVIHMCVPDGAGTGFDRRCSGILNLLLGNNVKKKLEKMQRQSEPFLRGRQIFYTKKSLQKKVPQDEADS